MPPNAKGKGGAGPGKRRAVRSDAEEALEDSQAEVNDVSAVLSSPAAAAGESAGPPKSAGPPPVLPPGLIARRLEKEGTEKENATYDGDFRNSDCRCVVSFFKVSWSTGPVF